MKKLLFLSVLSLSLLTVTAQEPKKCCSSKKNCTEKSNKKACKDKKACCKDKKACKDHKQSAPSPSN